MINLLENTTYYVRAYATNSAGTGYGNEISFRTLVAINEKGQPCSDIPSYKDIDGNTYNTVQIGTQCWTKENLRVSKYKDGTLIPFDESGGTTGDSLNETWSERITGARAVYGKNTQNIVTYGYLYNWFTVENPKGLCPSGWHVPSRSEFDKLITFLGGEEIAGGKMKTTGTTFWKTPNEGATNESGFSGLPGGFREWKGEYGLIGLFGAFWSSTNINTDINDPEVWLLSIGSENKLVGWTDVETLEMGASIRCLKDTIINNTTSLPTLTTTSVSTITSTSANTGGNITNDGGASITARGVVWSTNPNPTIALSTKTTQGTGIGTFTSILSNLTINTTYYIRAYATNSAGTGYGNELTFKTTPAAVVPTLTTAPVSSITSKTALSGGNISSDGGSSVIARGVVWSTNPNPTVSLTTKTTNGNGIGTFTSEMIDLLANTAYYVRAYATNSAGTGYGNEISFRTLVANNEKGQPCSDIPSYKDIDGNTYNTVQIGTQCWTKENLRVSKYKDGTLIPFDESGGTTGDSLNETWSERITGARAVYGKNTQNIVTYGYLYNWFTVENPKGLCPSGWHVPSRSEFDKLITFLGGEEIAGGKMKTTGTTFWKTPNEGATNESGFSGLPGGFREWKGEYGLIGLFGAFWSSTNINTDINDPEVWLLSIGSENKLVGWTDVETLEMGASIRCLKDTIINNTTSLPTLTTTSVNTITSTSANTGGNITNDGGASITARGVVWSTSTNPTISLTTKTSAGTGIGSFSSSLTNLTPKTTYYVRAYAINSVGTAYGNEISFTTSDSSSVMGIPCSGTPTVKDIDGNLYNTVQIGTQCWTKENLRVTKYRDGSVIPLDQSGYVNGYEAPVTWGADLTDGKTVYGHINNNLEVYGYLYNWYAAGDARGICPLGWHVPSRSEFDKLITFLGGEEIAGGKMKSIGTTYWNSPNTGGNNESGFSALPGGYRSPDGSFLFISSSGIFNSSTENDNRDAWSLRLGSSNSSAGTGSSYKSFGNSVRCLKDTASIVSIPSVTTNIISKISSSSATSGGNIISDSGTNIKTRGVVWSTSNKPTITLTTKTTDGIGTGSFTSNLINLTPKTIYYVRAYATNSAGTGYGNEISFTTSDSSKVMNIPCPGIPTLKDIDGNTYNTVQIGTQCWMKENLRVTKYRDGTFIPLDESGGTNGNSSGQTWSSKSTGARTVYSHSALNLSTYGYLYNWYAATEIKRLCPSGWSVPSDNEWTTLTKYLGGEVVAGGKMKTTGTTFWDSPNTGANNESGFSAYPGGLRNIIGIFSNVRMNEFFWSDTEYDNNSVLDLSLSYYNGSAGRGSSPKGSGLSVRCLKDKASIVSIPSVTTNIISSISLTSATSGGNITSAGGTNITARGVVWSTASNPTITLTTKTTDGIGIGTFTSALTGLTPNKTYYLRAYATNITGTGYGNEISFTTSKVVNIPCLETPTVKDVDGNTYNTVQIDTQCWMKENLRVKKYSDGTLIPLNESGGPLGYIESTWNSIGTGARSVYGHDSRNLITYGYLYNWYAAKGIHTTGSTTYKNVCPTGWHVPTDTAWSTLTTYLGGESVAGGKMKTVGTTYWTSPNTGATNENGFSAMPGGSRRNSGTWDDIRFTAEFWSATEYKEEYNEYDYYAWYIILSTNGSALGREYITKDLGASVRCLKD